MSSSPTTTKTVSTKVIRIYTVIPFSFPFSQKVLRFQRDKANITVSFIAEKRNDIIKKIFPRLMPRTKVRIANMNIGGSENIYDNWSWMSSDRFGQLNFMVTTFYIELDEAKDENLESNEARTQYLAMCADVINLISTGFRMLTNDYFPRNYTEQDFMAFVISYSMDGVNFTNEQTIAATNVSFTNYYPDDNLHFDINDIVSDFVMRIPLHTELMINAEDFYKDKNYRMSVIEADTAVESLLSKILVKYYSNLNVSDDFKLVFIKQLEKNRVDANVAYLKLVSNDIVENNKWASWKKNCHELRNVVIHQSKIITKSEAEEALSSAKEFSELLKEHLYEENDWLIEGKALSGNKELAIRYFSNSISKNQANPDAYFHLGNVYLQNREFDLAIDSYKKALTFMERADCYYKMGVAYEEQEQVDRSLVHYDRAIELGYEVDNPHNNPYYRKFSILIRRQPFDLVSIIKVLTFLFENFPNYSEFPLELFNAYAHKNEDKQALIYLNKLMGLSPDVPVFHIQRANFELRLGDKTKALDDIEKAITLDESFREQILNLDIFASLRTDERWKSILGV